MLDGILQTIGCSLPEAAFDAVSSMPEAAWESAANVAGVPPASAETRAVVLACFRRRARASVDAQIAQALSRALAAAREPEEVEP